MIKQDNSTFISFIVPVYNVEKYLSQCLDSILNQTYTDFEVVCVDDCSTDNSWHILNEYANKDHRVRIFRQPRNLRQGAARNRAIKEAKGVYISPIDSDDWLDINFCNEMATLAKDTGADIVRGGVIDYYSESKAIVEQVHINAAQLSKNRDLLNKYVIVNGGRVWGGLVSKELILKYELWYAEELFYEDNAICPFMYLLANSVVFSAKNLYYYRCNNVSTTRTKRNNFRFFDRIDTAVMFLNNSKKYGIYDKYKEEFDGKFILLIHERTTVAALTEYDSIPFDQIDKIYSLLLGLNSDYNLNKYYRRERSIIDRLILDKLLPAYKPYTIYIAAFYCRFKTVVARCLSKLKWKIKGLLHAIKQ